MRAEVDYAEAYRQFCAVLLPQWGGSIEAVRAFGQTCADTADYDTDVPLQMNEAAQALEPADAYGDAAFYASLERVFAGYEAAPSQVGRRVYDHSCHARAAELTGRYADAYRLLKEVDFQLSPDLAAELAGDPASGNYLERLAAYGGAGGDEARAGDRLFRSGHPEAARTHLLAALAAEAGEPRAAVYLRSRIATAEAACQLADGRWMPFLPAAGPGGAPVGWTAKLGTWKVAADGTLTGQTDASGLMLVNDLPVGPDFEVRGEMDFLPGAPGEQQAGVVFGHPDMQSDDWQSFRLKRNGPDGAVATISCHWHDGPKRTLAVPSHNAFVLQSWHGQITLTINGGTVFRAQRLDEGSVSDGSGLVGLGGYCHHGSPFAVAFRKLQLRRLGTVPPAENAEGGGRTVRQGSDDKAVSL